MANEAVKDDIIESIISGRGSETKKFLSQAPMIVAEMVEQIVEQKDVRIRTRLRSSIKSIIDAICIDTIHPSEDSGGSKKVLRVGGEIGNEEM